MAMKTAIPRKGNHGIHKRQWLRVSSVLKQRLQQLTEDVATSAEEPKSLGMSRAGRFATPYGTPRGSSRKAAQQVKNAIACLHCAGSNIMVRVLITNVYFFIVSVRAGKHCFVLPVPASRKGEDRGRTERCQTISEGSNKVRPSVRPPVRLSVPIPV